MGAEVRTRNGIQRSDLFQVFYDGHTAPGFLWPAMKCRYSMINWMSFAGSESKLGILVPARTLPAFIMNWRRRRGFQYSVTLQGEFSSGPNVPPTPLTAWHFRQCVTNSS